MHCMTTESEATEFARQWVAAWNSHDLDAIMSHYDVDVVLTSPVAAKILDDPSGTVEGNAALRNYFQPPLEVVAQGGVPFDRSGWIIQDLGCDGRGHDNIRIVMRHDGVQVV